MTIKKSLCILLVIAISFISAMSAFGAEIYWAEGDLTDRIIYRANFDEDGKSPMSGGTLVDASTVITGDTTHGNIVSSTGILWTATTGILEPYLEERSNITVQFDYYAKGTDNLRVELRSAAKSSMHIDLAETGSGQAPYWIQTEDLPGMAVSDDGQWHTFKGTLDTEKYLAHLLDIVEDAELTLGSAYIYIKLNGGTQLYTDNYVISAEPAVKALVSDPEYTYSWSPVTMEGVSNAYKATVNVTGSSVEFKAFEAQAPGGFFVDGGKYEASFKYMEDASNPYPMMRMWRFKNSKYAQPAWDNNSGYMYLTWEPEKEDFGNWNTITNTITLDADDAQDALLIDNGYFNLYWNTRSSGWTDEMKGNYTVYLADFVIKRIDAVSDESTTVAFEEDQFVQTGESLSVNVEGYFDITNAPVLNIGGDSVTGTWGEKTVIKDKYIKSTATFDTVTSNNYPLIAPYSATLDITDIWSRKESNPVNVTFINGASQKVEVLTGSWAPFASYPEEIDNTKNSGWAYRIDFSSLYNSGNTLIRISFDAKGDGTTVYENDAKQSMRVGNGIYLDMYVPAADLNDGQYHSYSFITDLGGLDRYDTYNTDRITSSHTLYLRKSEGNVGFKNIKFEYFDPESESKDIVVSRLKITNAVDSRFSPNGVLVFGEFEGSQLTDVGYKNISYTDTYVDDSLTYYNALGNGETKYVYFTGYEYGIKALNGMDVIPYDNSKTYRAFYWNDFESMMPQIAKNEIK